MNELQLIDEVLDHVDRLLEGVASEADMARLGDLLDQNAAARDAYRRLLRLHGTLHWQAGQTAACERRPGTQAPEFTRTNPAVVHPAARGS